jgi:hypothetical protein
MGKQFEKKFMHPTRRKLVDMVMNGGEYEKNTTISLSVSEVEQVRNVGDVWEDKNGNIWEQKDFGKVKKSKLSDTMSDVRNYLSKISKCKETSCQKKEKYGPTDKKLIRKTGLCTTCLAKKEWEVKKDGLWEQYEKYKVSTNMISYGTEILAKLNQAYNDAKQQYEYVNEDGSIEKWNMERNVDDLKSEIMEDIQKIKDELQLVIADRDLAWDSLKGKYADLLKPPTN